MAEETQAADAGEGERWRTFLAVELPEEIQQALSRPLDGLASLGRLVRLNPPDRVHLTLHFLGDVEVAQVENLRRGIEPVARAQTRFSVEVFGVGAFPSMARPRILWAGIGGPDRDRLIALQAALARPLREAGVALEDRVFSPHLTLGRLRDAPSAAQRAGLRRWQTDWAHVALGQVDVSTVALLRSVLFSGPPRHTLIARFPLHEWTVTAGS